MSETLDHADTGRPEARASVQEELADVTALLRQHRLVEGLVQEQQENDASAELAESAVIPGDQITAFHNATERLGPQGDIGQWFTFSLAGAPLLYLALDRMRRASPRVG